MGAVSGWILRGREAAAGDAGGKARALAAAEAAGLPVPPWFVLSSAAFHDSLTPAQQERLERGDPTSFALAADQASPAPAIQAALAEAVRELVPAGGLLAVRSSASDEDGTVHSFAGQLESYLNVDPLDVPERVRDVWRSGFSERIVSYRREHGLPLIPRAPAVIVQQMIAARSAGVAFSADPVSGRRGLAVVTAVSGLGSALASGEIDADTWLVDRTGAIVERRLAPKARDEAPSLSDAEVQEVAALARRAAQHFGSPQDVEWAFDDRLYLLQSRPITSLVSRHDPDARLVIWDNSNIVESYSGVTTPLTFSFAREIYEYVYRQFCRMMGVPERVIAAEDEMFQNMLGLIRGRLYYNLLSWYRLLAMLPGYRVNRRFMEQMMGVKDPLPDDLASQAASGLTRGRAMDAAYTIRTVTRLLSNHFTIDRRVDAFYRRLDAALAAPVPPLEERRLDELVAHYRDLRGRLLLKWDAPIVNDFFAMIYYGLLRTLVIKWCNDPGGTLQNDLIGGEGGIVSAEPAVRLQRLAGLAVANPALLQTLEDGGIQEVLAAAGTDDQFMTEYLAYLEKFGERTVNELKLESMTLHEDPLPLFRAVSALATQHSSPRATSGPTSADRLRTESRHHISEALSHHPVRRLIFAHVLRHARRRVRDRENLRLERTRLFGRVRRIFLEIGRRLENERQLDAARDVFYLEVGEVLAFAEGRATSTDLRALAAVRKREFQEYANGPAPDDRFETYGSPYQGHEFRQRGERKPIAGEQHRGLGCSPGVVRGRVCVVLDPTAVRPEPGCILVAEHTDPGWIMVFPSARGVLVERGSLLSHAAIVARELGIPAVVSLPGLTRWLKDGDVVEMDGSTGIVSRIDSAQVDA